MNEIIKICILYYIVLFVVYFAGGIQTKKHFLISVTPLAIIIYPLIWIINYYKALK
jgi:hypothetical protein